MPRILDQHRAAIRDGKGPRRQPTAEEQQRHARAAELRAKNERRTPAETSELLDLLAARVAELEARLP